MAAIIVENNLFKQMQSYKTLECNQKERQQLKHTFINRIKEKVSLRWGRAGKILQVIDEIIYKATDRGYSFNGRETLAKKCETSLATVDRAIRVLKDSNEVVVAYRHNPVSNGYKTPIFILRGHEHFKYWKDLLGLEDKLDDNVDDKVEKASNSGVSTNEGEKKTRTYCLPGSNNINHLNTKRHPYIKFVPRSLQHFQAFFGKQVKDIYGRIWLAAKKLGIATDQETMQNVGLITFEQLKKYVKEGKVLTEDQLCKLAYKIGYNQLNERLTNGEILDINEFYQLLDHIKKPERVQFVTKIERVTQEELDELGVF